MNNFDSDPNEVTLLSKVKQSFLLLPAFYLLSFAINLAVILVSLTTIRLLVIPLVVEANRLSIQEMDELMMARADL